MNKEKNFGTFDSKGHWKPPYPSTFSPVFGGSAKEILKYLFGWGGFLFPNAVIYMLLAIATNWLIQSDLATYGTVSPKMIGLVLLRNMVLVWIVYGGYHLLFYKLKVQGETGKYHPEWGTKVSKRHLFNNQVYDNVFRACVSGVPIWTAYEVLYIFLVTNGYLRMVTFKDNPVYFILILLLIPFFRESHFYFAHKILHMGWMMRKVHTVHHMNPNPSPWSGMAMHPVEHILYFSTVLIHFIVPSHPIHFFYNMQLTGLTPAPGHVGFEGPLLGGLLPYTDYFHYLHHKHVSCNFGTTSVPWDKWFGIYYDGEGPYKGRRIKFIDRSGDQ